MEKLKTYGKNNGKTPRTSHDQIIFFLRKWCSQMGAGFSLDLSEIWHVVRQYGELNENRPLRTWSNKRNTSRWYSAIGFGVARKFKTNNDMEIFYGFYGIYTFLFQLQQLSYYRFVRIWQVRSQWIGQWAGQLVGTTAWLSPGPVSGGWLLTARVTTSYYIIAEFANLPAS